MPVTDMHNAIYIVQVSQMIRHICDDIGIIHVHSVVLDTKHEACAYSCWNVNTSAEETDLG